MPEIFLGFVILLWIGRSDVPLSPLTCDITTYVMWIFCSALSLDFWKSMLGELIPFINVKPAIFRYPMSAIYWSVVCLVFLFLWVLSLVPVQLFRYCIISCWARQWWLLKVESEMLVIVFATILLILFCTRTVWGIGSSPPFPPIFSFPVIPASCLNLFIKLSCAYFFLNFLQGLVLGSIMCCQVGQLWTLQCLSWMMRTYTNSYPCLIQFDVFVWSDACAAG